MSSIFRPQVERGGSRSLTMIVLYGGGAGFGLPEVSPYVTKAEVLIKTRLAAAAIGASCWAPSS